MFVKCVLRLLTMKLDLFRIIFWNNALCSFLLRIRTRAAWHEVDSWSSHTFIHWSVWIIAIPRCHWVPFNNIRSKCLKCSLGRYIIHTDSFYTNGQKLWTGGRAFNSNTRNLRFESSHFCFLSSVLNKLNRTDKKRKKRQGMAQIEKWTSQQAN